LTITKDTDMEEVLQSQEITDMDEGLDIEQPYTKIDKGKGKNIINQEYSSTDKDQQITRKDNTTTEHTRLTKIAIDPEKIPGVTPTNKLQYIKKKVAKISLYKYTKYKNYTGKKILMALFGKHDEAEQACTIPLIKGGNIFFKKVQATDIKKALSCTICIWDIPTDLTKKNIATALTNYRLINQITIQQANSCLSSTVTLHNMDDYQELNQKWSISYKNYHIRIFPYFGTREAKENRNKYTATIANLLENITAKNLEHIIKQVNAQTCYIPKKDDNNYKRLAIFAFHNQKDRKQATNQNFQVKGHDITWKIYNPNISKSTQSTFVYMKKLNKKLHGTEIKERHKEVKLLDNRISYLETDIANRYFDEMEQIEEDLQATTMENMNTNNNSDLIEAQVQINQKINKMDETIEKLINTFILLSNTPPANSTHNIPTTFTQ
ncbi:6527_t:CDS:2, partial [Acaulospora morrowiae]